VESLRFHRLVVTICFLLSAVALSAGLQEQRTAATVGDAVAAAGSRAYGKLQKPAR
jgi:hypothetical protein